MKHKSTLIKSTFIIMLVTLVSRLLGLVRELLIGKGFGAGVYTDAYNIAVPIPETIFALVGLAISTAFLPTLSKIKAKKGKAEMYAFANNVISILLVVSIIIFIISSFFAKEIVYSFKPSEATATIAIGLLKITLLNILFLSINACFTALLQVNEDFVIPSILGLFFNLPMILYLLLCRNYDILGLTIANVLGNFFRVVVQVPSLITHGYKYRFCINLKDERLKAIIILIIPVVIGAGANSLNMLVDKYMAFGLHQDGAVSELEYAQKLIVFINTIIVTSVNSIVYPLMANMQSNEDKAGFVDILKKSIVYLAILLIPITIGIIIYNKEIISLAYERGAFDAKVVEATSPALFGYGFGVFFTGMRDILNSTLFTMGKTKITTINGIIGVIINIIFCIILSKYMGLMGIAIASVIAMAVTAILLFRSIVKLEKSLNIKDIVKKIGLITINSLIMGLIIITLIVYLKNKLNSLTLLLLGVIVGSIVYFILCYLFRIEEVIEIKDFILKKINR